MNKATYPGTTVEIKPFKAFRFDKAVVGDVGACIAPPYDVIDPALQNRLYEKSRYNIVRIIKGKTEPSDNSENNQYSRAADYLNTWINEGVLKQDLAEAIYAYVQDFEAAGTCYQRSGFIALAKIEQFGKGVKPHEQTLDAPIVDRLNLQRAAGAKFGLVFMVYEDRNRVAESVIEDVTVEQPVIDFTDDDGVRHRLFAITAAEKVTSIAQMMRDKDCIIADGHHRYATALAYARQTANPAAAYQMTAFSNMCSQGLVVLATHRLISGADGFDFGQLLNAMRKDFEITEYFFPSQPTKAAAMRKMFNQMKTELANARNAFGMYAADKAFYTVVLKDKRIIDTFAPEMNCALKCLDVVVLHKLVLEKLLSVSEENQALGRNVEYLKDTENAVDQAVAEVDAGRKQLAFFMNPPTIDQIKKAARAGARMPQKSTFFYPKAYSGLTIQKL